MRLLQAIPALPVKDIARSVEFYRERLEFQVVRQEDGFAIVRRDAAEVHLWAANDERWRSASRGSPVVSGAESFIAGTASCRIGVAGVDQLHRTLAPWGIVHPKGQLGDRPWGTREFGVLDLEGNLLTFFERV